MKFKFKIQQYQTDAVNNTVDVFSGQPSKTSDIYRRDLGNTDNRIVYEDEYTGYRNQEVELNDQQLLDNIQRIQVQSEIPQSSKLIKQDGLGRVSLDIEMETGTGKTYVYIKTMFELNKRYGWSKFIVVVPSIAIREGVNKSFNMLEDHFMEQYGKKARYFIYNSSNLNEIDSFSSDDGIHVMIINVQAFNTSFKEGARNKEARIIYTKRDDFQSRRPIDVIAANHPIIIMDEPQKMEGAATMRALKHFMPLFMMNYSATHKTHHNCIYALDALDAYRKKLVKKIQVKGITLMNLLGTNGYIYFDSIILSKNHAPQVKLEIEVKRQNITRRQTLKFEVGDKLYDASHLHVYDGFEITDINPLTNKVSFMNGDSLKKSEVMGDVSEKDIQRVQIRETIKSHFEKERTLFQLGIKTLSLFFIDEVDHYENYDDAGNLVHGYLWKMFEEEYQHYLSENLSLFDAKYQKYLLRFQVAEVHKGYFSIDKKGHVVNSVVKRGETDSNDISAYDLILKNKERLLSFEEPTRFIFSHSALREGWDNPNVFQICTLRHANSETAKRQEVGRGLRICVDQNGNRMDYERLGDAVHDINKLTVIANESYSTFVNALQKETHETLRERPTNATADYFNGLPVMINGQKHLITEPEADSIVSYLFENDYINDQGQIKSSYYKDLNGGTLAPFGKKLQPMEQGIHTLIQSIYNPSLLEGMFEDANQTAEAVNSRLNANAEKEAFKQLWNEINHRYVYTVHYDSEELIAKVIQAIDFNLNVTQLKYIVKTGIQDADDIDFNSHVASDTHILTKVSTSTVKYDLVGEIAQGATLTRHTVVQILKGILPAKQLLFKNNPEEFIRNVIKIIREQKATMIIDHISYNRTENTYDLDIFTQEKTSERVDKAYLSQKNILDYVFTDSEGEEQFAKDLDGAGNVEVYARLPRSFQIPTPVGNYAPDWAIAFKKGSVKHIFFIAETKGSLVSMQLRPIETAKITCAKHLFNYNPVGQVRYHDVTSYQNLLDVMNNID